MPIIYGDSYGNYEQNRQANEGRIASNYFNSLAANRAVRQQQMAEQEAANRDALQWASLQQRGQENALSAAFRERQMADDTRRFDMQDSRQLQDMAQRNALGLGSLDLARRQFDWQSGPGVKEDQGYADGLKAASQLLMGPPTDALSYSRIFGVTNPDKAAIIDATAENTLKKFREVDRWGEGQANALTDMLTEDRRKTGAATGGGLFAVTPEDVNRVAGDQGVQPSGMPTWSERLANRLPKWLQDAQSRPAGPFYVPDDVAKYNALVKRDIQGGQYDNSLPSASDAIRQRVLNKIGQSKIPGLDLMDGNDEVSFEPRYPVEVATPQPNIRRTGGQESFSPSMTVTTKQQYDSLPPGASFMGADGKRYIKPLVR